LASTKHTGLRGQLAQVDRHTLTQLARSASGNANFALASWKIEPIYGGMGGAIGGTALFCFTLIDRQQQPLRLVLKVLMPRPQETEHSPYYWKREYEIYRAGTLEALQGSAVTSIHAPQIYALEERDGNCWIWMQYIPDERGEWTSSDFRRAARILGEFNGAWLEQMHRLPNASWLAQDWHSAIVPGLEGFFAQVAGYLDDPLVQMALPLSSYEEIMRIWQDRELFRTALTQIPQTFCHNDAFRRNLLTCNSELVLIDWALAGRGRLGEELVSMVAVSLHYEGFSRQLAQELDALAFTQYIAGLRAAGWRGDALQARLGYTCGMTLRGLAGVKQDINQLRDPAAHASLLREHQLKRIEDVARLHAAVRNFRLLQMAREARQLLAN